jgi:UDP-N-acetylglucosamine--N-acetylmuramyl-(pentapeptide) pyrophosphoryl-undecaprenol N-acetylglucosamine transferase
MRVLVTGGGSAGHITPILSVATELKKHHPSVKIRYIGQTGDKLRHIVAGSNDIEKTKSILAGKWRRYHDIGVWAHVKDVKTIAKNLRDIIFFAIGFLQSIVLLIFWRPHVVFVKGGYVGLPVGLAAALLRVPIVTHDSDAQPGLTNRVLSRFASKQCVGMPVSYYVSYSPDKLEYTGVPIRAEYQLVTPQLQAKARQNLKLPDSNARVIAAIGGSLGAVRLNHAIMDATAQLLETSNVYLLHVCGASQFDEVDAFYNRLAPDIRKKVHVWAFSDKIYEITAAADIVISRAGATAVAELSSQAKPVILIPNPYLVGGHQTQNARILEAENAVCVITEKQLADARFNFAEQVLSLLDDEERKQTLASKLHSLSVPNVSKRIAQIIYEVGLKK